MYWLSVQFNIVATRHVESAWCMCTYIHSANKHTHRHARMFTIYYNVRRTSSLHNNSTKRCFFVLVGGLLLHLAEVEPHAFPATVVAILCHVFKILFALVHLFSLQAHYCFFHPYCGASMLTLSILWLESGSSIAWCESHFNIFSAFQNFQCFVVMKSFDLAELDFNETWILVPNRSACRQHFCPQWKVTFFSAERILSYFLFPRLQWA